MKSIRNFFLINRQSIEEILLFSNLHEILRILHSYNHHILGNLESFGSIDED